VHEEPLPLGDTYVLGGWALHYSASVVATCGPTQRAAAELGGGMSVEDTQDTLREPQTLAPEQLEARLLPMSVARLRALLTLRQAVAVDRQP
jgi:hypothetical protein